MQLFCDGCTLFYFVMLTIPIVRLVTLSHVTDDTQLSMLPDGGAVHIGTAPSRHRNSLNDN